MASKKPSGLGRGLGALLGDDVLNTQSQATTSVPITDVGSNSAQPRKHFDEAALAELAEEPAGEASACEEDCAVCTR